MKAVFRIFDECFMGDEWTVVVDVPEYFLNNIHLNDIISSQLLMSFPEFNSQHFMDAIKEENMIDFSNRVQNLMEKQGFSQTKAVVEVWYDWMSGFNLTVAARKWSCQPGYKEFYLEFWMENK